jgi:hypothetical protein
VEKPDPCVPNPCGPGAVCILQVGTLLRDRLFFQEQLTSKLILLDSLLQEDKNGRVPEIG